MARYRDVGMSTPTENRNEFLETQNKALLSDLALLKKRCAAYELQFLLLRQENELIQRLLELKEDEVKAYNIELLKKHSTQGAT